MYRVYAQAFFIISVLLAVVIFFNPEERFPFLGKVDVYVVLVAMMLFASFPVVLAIRYLFKAKKVIFRVESKKMRQVAAVLKSKTLRFTGNVFGFLLVLLVCTIFIWFLMRGFGKFVSRPFFGGLTKFIVRSTVQQTLSEMDFYTTRSLSQADANQLKSSVERFEDYVRDKEYATFLEKGARREISQVLGTDNLGNKVEFKFYFDSTWNSVEDEFTDFSYYVVQKTSSAEGRCIDGCISRVADFKIKSTDDPVLNFEVFEVPNETELGVLVVWWNSDQLKRYVIFGPNGESYYSGDWEIACFEGCESVATAEERPTFIVSENEKTGETEYIIKTGEYSGPHLINYDYSGYVVVVNDLGGLDLERLEFRQ